MRLVLIFLFIPLFSTAQKGFFNIQAGADFPGQLDPGFSARISGGAVFNNMLHVGGGAGVTKLGRIEGAYVPFFANFIFTPARHKKTYPVITLQPGFAAYSRTVGETETTGSFTFYGGPGLGSNKMQLTLGYSYFGFDTEGTKTYYQGVSFRLGVTL